MFRRNVPLRVDASIVVLLILAGAIGSTLYWKRITKRGQPFYYQYYFEPAAMIACGKGFVVARPQVPAMVPFLWRQTDQFSCAEIAPDTPLGTDDMYQQGNWRYLMLAVGYTWRLFGVSWSALGPLFGVLFGATIAGLYAVFRLGMGPLLAVAGAVALSFSALHLKIFFILRDYSKAPFTLALFFLLGLLVGQPATWRRALSIGAAYGAILGVGYGFRTDFLAAIPPFFLTLALFLEGGVVRHVPLKAAAAATCAAAFLVTAWPVIATLDRSRGGCQPHHVAAGFASRFSGPLGVEPAPYQVLREFLDEFAYTEITSYAARVNPGAGHIEYCEASYGAATRAYLTEVVRHFPADVIVRAYATVLRIIELPFAPVPGIDYEGDTPPRSEAALGMGLVLVLAAVGLITAASVRLGLFVVAFLLYFGGLPAIQFDHRHFFHLEFITWWAGGFLMQAALTDLPPLLREPQRRRLAASGARAVALLTGCFAVLASMLWIARAYQQPKVRAMLNDYLAAPRVGIPLAQLSASDQGIRVSPHTDPETADFIAVDINASRCGEHSTVAFRYDETASRRAYGRVFAVPRTGVAGFTHILMPIYDGFRRLELPDAPDGCVDGVYRVRDPRRFALLLEAVLPPGWRRLPLYQRLAGRDIR